LGGLVFFCNRRVHLACSFDGDYRDDDMDHSGAARKQANSEEKANGERNTMPPQGTQMIAGDYR
jgi:hypothetical protein